MTIEDIIRRIVREELDRPQLQQNHLQQYQVPMPPPPLRAACILCGNVNHGYLQCPTLMASDAWNRGHSYD